MTSPHESTRDGERPLPREYWIELTSTCPFDCVFCSRKTLRGNGQQLSFTTYQQLMGEIGHPRVIRLNYAGESMHYPHLIEAVRMAVATGAIVEMVTALASARADLLQDLLETGIHDLCVSLHTLDEKLFGEIYGYGELGKMLQRLEQVSTFAKRRPEFHFEIAFVAMARNLHELPAIAALAERLGARRLVVHPVIRRDDIPEAFAEERVDGRMTESFRLQLREQVEDAKAAVEGMPVALSSPELEADIPPAPGAAFDCAAPLPHGARIVGCHQSPFDTVHILANGDVVTCEVRDRIPLGNLTRETLREIWNGQAYRQFRKGFHAGLDNHCRNCAYKIVRLSSDEKAAETPPPKAGPTSWRQRLRLAPLTLGIEAVDFVGRHLPARAPKSHPTSSTRPGLSVLVPEYDNLQELGDTLDALALALQAVDEPTDVLIVVNGSPAANYRELAARFPAFRWMYFDQALGFGGAIRAGLAAVRHDWVYLLNSDMTLDPNALKAVMAVREDGVFAIGSQIFFKDANRRREETGWADFTLAEGELRTYDRVPDDQTSMRGNAYAGGGSSLFRTEPLRRYAEHSQCYDPFYWEDADWGVSAIRDGWEVLFCPQSIGWHGHRSTIAGHFDRAGIDTVVARNAVLFEIRHALAAQPVMQLAERIKALPYREQRHSLKLSLLPEMLSQRLRAWTCGVPAGDILRINDSFRMPGPRTGRPKLIVVTPFCIFPPAHGGARRVAEMVTRAQTQYDVVLLSDERSRYTQDARAWLEKLYAVYLVEGRPLATMEKDWSTRADNHCHPRLQRELQRLIRIHRPIAVQIEHLELAPLVNLRSGSAGNAPWILDMHDAEPPETLGALVQSVAKYDARIVTSGEDRALIEAYAPWTITNGFPEPKTPPLASPPQGFLLFVGAMRYAPNREGLTAFLEQAWPTIRAALPALELVVMGGEGATEIARRELRVRREGVRILDGYHEPSGFYADAALTINPQSNIRGSALKVVESLAAGRICVSMSEGVRGYAELKTDALQVVEDYASMAARIIELVSDVEKRHRMEADRREAIDPLSWNALSADWLGKIAALAKAHGKH